MKTFITPLLLFLFTSIVSTTNAQSYVDELDPQRSIYVDKFVTYNVISINNGSPVIDPANSILGVDVNHDGIFEKERALLEYCMDHHITSLVLLDLHKVLGMHVYAWNQNDNRDEDLEDHLCRFMDEARNYYCITEIIASGQSSGFFNSTTGTSTTQFINPSPPFSFTPQQKNSPSFSSSLLLAEDNTLQPGDESYYLREFLKFSLRAAFFGTSGTCNERFNRLHMEYEFWQNGVDDLLLPIINNPAFSPPYVVNSSCNCSIPYSSNQYYMSPGCSTQCALHTYPNNQQGKFDLVFIPVINTIRSIKKLVNAGLIPSDPNYIKCEAYLHSLSTIPNWNALQIFMDGNPNAAAQASPFMTNDKQHLFDLTCPIGAGATNPNPDYDMLPNIERPLPAQFIPSIGGTVSIPAGSLGPDGFEVPSDPNLLPTADWMQNNTDLHYILNGESIANNGYDDYFGAWFKYSSDRNIFEAERLFYNRWRNDRITAPIGFTAPTTNDVHRGAVLWYTQTQLDPTNHHDPLLYQLNREKTKIFTSDNPWCGSTASPANVAIHYIGPSESSAIISGNQVEIKFWLTDCNGNAIAGQPSLAAPVITKTYSATYYFNNLPAYAAPDINLLISPVTGCNFLIGHMKLTYNQGCSYEYQENLYINSSPTITAMGNTTFCDGDYVILRANNGGAGATYTWRRNGQNISGANGNEYSATLAGDYSCQITGSSSCTGLSNTIIVTVNPSPPVAIITDCSAGNGILICDYDLSGGQPYTQGPNGETYQWSTGETTNKITLPASTYANYFINVTVTTPAGCKKTDWKQYSNSGTIPITATPNQASTSCSQDGSVTLSTNCGCGPYRLRIYDGSHFQDDQWRVGPTHTFGGLTPGNYTAVVTGSFGMCYSTASFTILPNSTTNINATITPSTPTCSSSTNGQIVISNITPSAANYIVTVNGISYSNVGSGITISNLLPGVYPIKIEAPAPDCSYKIYQATINPAHTLSATTTITPVACSGGNTGGASSIVEPTGGNYNYLWMPGNFTTANISSRPAGSYLVTVTDAWGCTATAYANISPPPAISIAVVNQINPCQGSSNGSLELDLSGGTGSYSISPGTWNLNSSGFYERTGMGANSYSITVTSDACSASRTINLTPVSLTFNVTNATCAGNSNGAITAIPANGTGPFTYNWNPGGLSPGSTLVNQSAGNYVCTVTDNNGCTASSTAIISNGGLIVTATPDNILCNGGTTSVTVSASGGSGSYIGTGQINGVAAGPHTYTVNDNNGCSGSSTITILQPNVISVTTLYNNILCNGGTTNVTVLATGGTGVYTSGTGVRQNLTAGNYSSTVTDNVGCTASLTYTISQPTALAVAFQNISNPCIGGSSGSVTAVASGGTPSYSYSWNTVPVQNSAQASGLTAGAYIVTVTDGNGCTTTASYAVTENLSCCGNYPTDLTQTIIDNLTSPFELTGQYNLNSNLSITKNVTLKGCTLAIAGGVIITIQNGKTFTITDQSGVTSWLYACGDMWGGIINSGGIVIVNNNSLIQDAITAITSTNGDRVVVTGARFNKNYYDISLSNGSFPASQTAIYGNLFDCSTNISKAPHINQITRAHIQLDNVTDLVVGDATRNANTFLKGAIGINANYSSLFVYHNDFNPQNGKSAAIRGKGAGARKDGNLIIVGGSGSNEFNSFANAGWGVQCNGVEKVNSYFNNFNNCIRGISLTTIRESVSTNNTVKNFYNGIEIYDAILPDPGDLCCPENHIVTYNSFNPGLNYGIDLISYGNTAIDVRNKVPQFTPVTVTTNSILNSAIGIHFLNSNGSKAIDGNTYDSQIPFDQTTSDHFGIWVQNSNNVKVIGNSVIWSGPFASGSTSRDLLQNQKGIAVARSFKCVFEENAVRNFAAGFNIFDDCTNDNLYCNLMDNCYNGVFLDDQNPNNRMTDQGVAVFNPNYDHDLSTSWHNRWKNNIDNKVDGLYNGANFRWLYSDAPYDPEYDPSPSAFMVFPQSCLLSLSGCTTPTSFIDDEKRKEAFGKAVGDSSEAEIDSVEYAHGDKAFFYKQAKDNPDYLNLGYPTDVLYQLKYNLIAQTNIGKFEDIKASLSSKEIQEAINKLNSMQNLNSIDENNKFISGLIALGYDVDLDLDSDTVALVTAIALQHPFYGGEAVYMARAMLRIDVHDQMPIYRKGIRPKGNKSINNIVVVYPNPTTNSFTIFSNQLFNESELKIYNSYGEQIRFIELPEQQSIFNVSLEDLPSGIYSIKITSLNKLVKQDKLVLIK